MIEEYSEVGVKKTQRRGLHLFLLGIHGGVLLGFAAIVTTAITYDSIDRGNASLISGLLFPFGLAMITLCGGELLLGNTLICISVLEKKVTICAMLRNWAYVFAGNLVGGIFLAFSYVHTPHISLANNELILSVINTGIHKLSYTFLEGLILGMLCNILVATAVLQALGAKDLVGKVLGAYIPVAFFIMAGFENSAANMYYIPMAIFTANIPHYAELAHQAGVDTSSLTFGNFLLLNQVPVILGNILGGFYVGWLLWYCNLAKEKKSI